MLLQDVASLRVGNQPRLGIAGEGHDDDIVMGIVLMQRGEDSRCRRCNRVEAGGRQDQLASGILPPGVHLEKIYDRTDADRC